MIAPSRWIARAEKWKARLQKRMMVDSNGYLTCSSPSLFSTSELFSPSPSAFEGTPSDRISNIQPAFALHVLRSICVRSPFPNGATRLTVSTDFRQTRARRDHRSPPGCFQAKSWPCQSPMDGDWQWGSSQGPPFWQYHWPASQLSQSASQFSRSVPQPAHEVYGRDQFPPPAIHESFHALRSRTDQAPTSSLSSVQQVQHHDDDGLDDFGKPEHKVSATMIGTLLTLFRPAAPKHVRTPCSPPAVCPALDATAG